MHQKVMGHILAAGGGIVALAVFAAFLIWYGRSSAPRPMATVVARAVPFTEITRGDISKVTTRVNYLITNESELDKLWTLVSSSTPKPKIDFGSNLLAAVFAGAQPTTGYAIQVSKIEDADKRNVVVEIVKPDGGCVPKHATTTPFQIVQLPRTSLSFDHQDAVITKSCR